MEASTIPGASPDVRGSRRARALLGRVAPEQLGLSGMLVIACVIISMQSPYFFQGENFANIGTAVAVSGVMAAFTTIVLIGGGLDLSLGAVLVFAGWALAVALDAGYTAEVAILFALAAGAACGLVNALLIVGVGINPFIVTIGTQFAFRGLTYAWSGGGAKSTPVEDPTIVALGSDSLLGIPLPVFVLAGMFLLAFGLLRYTRFGSNVYAIGGNLAAARLSGVRVDRTRVLIYVLSSLSAAVSGILLIGISGAAIPIAGQGIELTVLAAVILGGTALMGGRGSVVGTLLGVLLLGVINNGLTLLSAPSYWQMIVQGVALLLAVVFDEVRRKRKETR
ncbi:MAG TPA: ABC transporter permease [Conexibacter sp.]|nr:ABC transporter permease [Conexibacter sp.]